MEGLNAADSGEVKASLRPCSAYKPRVLAINVVAGGSRAGAVDDRPARSRLL